jgi:ribose 5-phosphate isomerase B
MKVAVGSDHAGFDLKEKVKKYLLDAGFDVHDLGTAGHERVDYPDYAAAVAREVRRGDAERGILLCGTGVGVCIAANKIDGIRAAAAWDLDIARLSRQHNDANVLCLPGRHMDHEFALEVVLVWMNTAFEGGRHKVRVDKIASLETSH